MIQSAWRLIRAPIMSDKNSLVRKFSSECLKFIEACVLRGTLSTAVQDQQWSFQQVSVQLLIEPTIRGVPKNCLAAKAKDKTKTGLGMLSSMRNERKVIIYDRFNIFRRRNPIGDIFGRRSRFPELMKPMLFEPSLYFRGAPNRERLSLVRAS